MYNTDLPARAELPSTGKLLRSTAIAAAIAAGLLVTTILPAEYGIDPTGIGSALGLTEMGEIKVSLEEDAHADAQAPQVTPAVAPPSSQAAKTEEAPATAAPPGAGAEPAEEPAAEAPTPGREDTMTMKLKQGEATEIKLTMHKGAAVRYEWASVGGAVNYDTHGEPMNAPKNFYHGYGKGRNKASDAGVLEAAFDGKHGWFWRNRSGSEVTITLKTSGDYTDIKKVL